MQTVNLNEFFIYFDTLFLKYFFVFLIILLLVSRCNMSKKLIILFQLLDNVKMTLNH